MPERAAGVDAHHQARVLGRSALVRCRHCVFQVKDHCVSARRERLGKTLASIGGHKQEGARGCQLTHAERSSNAPTRDQSATPQSAATAVCISTSVAPPLNAARRNALAVISARLSVLPGSPLGSSTRPCSTRPSPVCTVTLPIQRFG